MSYFVQPVEFLCPKTFSQGIFLPNSHSKVGRSGTAYVTHLSSAVNSRLFYGSIGDGNVFANISLSNFRNFMEIRVDLH